MNRQIRFLILCLLCVLPAFLCGAAVADTLPTNYAKALKYVKTNQPMEAVAENVGWNPKQLTEVKEALPEGAVFHFTCKWNGLVYSDESEDLDLNKAQKDLGEKTLRLVLALCPKLRSVDNSGNKIPTNDTFIALMEEYPDIHFEWLVHLRGEHYCPTNATAYSTLNHTDYGTRLKSADMELLQYIPGLKALDVGHNAFTDLSFLRFFPDLIGCIRTPDHLFQECHLFHKILSVIQKNLFRKLHHDIQQHLYLPVHFFIIQVVHFVIFVF